jgi:hypothetical protein
MFMEGQADRIRLESTPGEGTAVMVKFPSWIVEKAL